MDTQTAIQVLQGVVNTLTDEVKGSQAKLDATNVAITQLQGLLATQDLAAQQQITDLTNQVNDLTNQLAAAQAQIAALQQQTTPPTPAPVTPAT